MCRYLPSQTTQCRTGPIATLKEYHSTLLAMACESMRHPFLPHHALSTLSSYTSFMYSDLVVTPSEVKAGGNVTVKVTVQNTGSVDGHEVGVATTSL